MSSQDDNKSAGSRGSAFPFPVVSEEIDEEREGLPDSSEQTARSAFEPPPLSPPVSSPFGPIPTEAPDEVKGERLADAGREMKSAGSKGAELFSQTSPETVSGADVPFKNVLIVGAKAHAVGLRWRVINDIGQARHQAREAAEPFEDLFVSTMAGEPSIGIGSSTNGHTRGMPVLAGRLASAITGDWSGLFALDGAYYVIAVRGGMIDDRSDIAFIEKSDALRCLVDVVSGGTGRILVTQDLVGDIQGIAGIEAYDPLQVLTGSSRIDLEPIEIVTKFPTALVALGAAGAVAAILFLNIGGSWDKAKRMAGFAPPPEKQVVNIPPAPWAGQPKASAMMRVCVAAFRVLPAYIRSWRVDKAECDGRRVWIVVGRTGTVDGSAPPANWLDDWVRTSGTLVTRGFRLEKPVLSRSPQGVITVGWQLPAYSRGDRWREADRPEPINDEQHRLWLEMERRFVPVNIVTGGGNQYFASMQINVSFEPFQVDRVAEAFEKKVQVASRLIFDVQSKRITASTRIFRYAAPFPTGENVEIIRQPTIAQVEGPTLPPPPP